MKGRTFGTRPGSLRPASAGVVVLACWLAFPAQAWEPASTYSSDSIYAGSAQPYGGGGAQQYGSGGTQQGYGGVKGYGTGSDSYGGSYQGGYGSYQQYQAPQAAAPAAGYPQTNVYEQQYGDWGATGRKDTGWYPGEPPLGQQGVGQPSVYAPQYQFRQDREIGKPPESGQPSFRPYAGAGGTDYTWGTTPGQGQAWGSGATAPAPVFRPLDGNGKSREKKTRSAGPARGEGVAPLALPAPIVDPYTPYPGVGLPGYGWGGYSGLPPAWGAGQMWDPGVWLPGDGGWDFPFF
ncbi:MAG: hypothetical protein PVF91_02560 [Chromatiales bacterium]